MSENDSQEQEALAKDWQDLHEADPRRFGTQS